MENPIAVLPLELQFNIFRYLSDTADAAAYRITCRTNRDAIDSYFSRTIYYAVGSSLELYYEAPIDPFGDMGPAYAFLTRSESRWFMPHDVIESLPCGKFVMLFKDFSTALQYQYYKSPAEYISQLDYFSVYQEPAIFVVQLKNGLVKKVVHHLKEYWLSDAPHPPKAQEAAIEGFKTSKNNIDKICMAQFTPQTSRGLSIFNFRFFSDRAFSSFEEIWKEAMRGDLNSLRQSAYKAVYSLFKSYTSPFYASWTRSHQQKVNEILIFLETKPEIKDLLPFLRQKLNEFYRAADSDQQLNVNGHYARMLSYAITNMNKIEELLKLPELENYIHYER